jgi:hypothetical protein
MNTIKENIKSETAKTIQALKWDTNEFQNQLKFLFDTETFNNNSFNEVDFLLTSLSDEINKIKMLVNLLK